MAMDFAAILLMGSVATGIVALLDRVIWRKQRPAGAAEPVVIEYSRSFFPVLLVVFLLRSFVVEPYRIPSGSMDPTLLVGDFIVVNKYTYGLRLPIIMKKVVDINQPKRGDVMVFRYPVDPSENFIKRVVGLPGDRIDYKNKELRVNGELMAKNLVGDGVFLDEAGNSVPVEVFKEKLGSKEHLINERLGDGTFVQGIVVPPGHYFMMGDNRDDSDDSRMWGFVPDKLIVGKALAVWISWDSVNHRLRYERFGDLIS